MKYFKLIFLLVLLIFFYDVYKGNDIFEKLKELEIIDSLISNDFYITFSLLAIVIAIYSTILNYKEDLKKLIDKKEHSLNKIMVGLKSHFRKKGKKKGWAKSPTF